MELQPSSLGYALAVRWDFFLRLFPAIDNGAFVSVVVCPPFRAMYIVMFDDDSVGGDFTIAAACNKWTGRE